MKPNIYGKIQQPEVPSIYDLLLFYANTEEIKFNQDKFIYFAEDEIPHTWWIPGSYVINKMILRCSFFFLHCIM
jgi:hypothetical protein